MSALDLRAFLALRTPNVNAAFESVLEEHFQNDPTTRFIDLALKTQEVYSLHPIVDGTPVNSTLFRWELELVSRSGRTTVH